MFDINFFYFLPMLLTIFLLESAIYTILVILILHKIKMLYTNYDNLAWIHILESIVMFILLQVILILWWEFFEYFPNDVIQCTIVNKHPRA